MATLVGAVLLASLHGVLRDVANEFARHGYVIVFVLIAAESFAFPLPGEVSLLVGAYEAHRGVFGLGWVIVVGALAAMTGDNLAYLFGRRRGRSLLERLMRLLHVRTVYLERLEASFGRHAGWAIIVARQLSPVRGLAALSAGVSGIAWPRFALFNAIGCVAWATVVTLVASLFVRHLDELADDISLAGVIVLCALAAAAGVYAWRRLRRRVISSADGGVAEGCHDEPSASAEAHAGPAEGEPPPC